MSEIAIAFLGDVVGAAGRKAVAHAIPILKERHNVRAVIVNGENARQGSGITADNARELFQCGVNAITLGDHCYKDRAILPLLDDPHKDISRPANLATEAPGKRTLRLEISGMSPLYIITVLGRLFMPIPSDNPFAAADREILALPEKNAAVIVEVHAEATSEKQAMAWHCLEKWTSPAGPRVVAVLGTHTHVQTADARILDHMMAAMTDLGMTGPHRGVIGRSAAAVLQAMVHQSPAPLDVASDDVRACGAVIRIDPESRRAVGIQAIDIPLRD